MQVPAGARVLFDGRGLEAWASADQGPPRWRIVEGALQVEPGTGDLVSRETFRDLQLHLEFRVPRSAAGATGQDRGNSGVFLLGRYEIQILDCAGERPDVGGCGAVYGMHAPLFAVTKAVGIWQAWDIVFRAPVLNSTGLVAEHARLTLLHDGVAVHNNLPIAHPTKGALDVYEALPGPIHLQDHGHAVQFRNIWVLPGPGR